MTNVLRLVAAGTVLAGIVIGLVCAPYMFSAGMVDVTGAGLGCLTGAVLLSGGLQSLAVLDSRSANSAGKI
jgi:hypothetical protein